MKQGTKNRQNLIFIEARWFNTVGFVLCQDYIGREYKIFTHKLGGDYNDDFSLDQDINKILGHGSTFPLETANSLFDYDIKNDWVHDHPEDYL